MKYNNETAVMLDTRRYLLHLNPVAYRREAEDMTSSISHIFFFVLKNHVCDTIR